MVLAVPTVVLVVTDRLARHALPLAVLLKMTMVFPDRAPKRLAVARKAGNTRDLERRVEEAKTHGIEDEPVLAAEKILALAGALNAHDRLTRGHGERVRAFTDLIADELDLPSEDRDRLRWSALLHDIGKLAVHPHILNKPDKLDDEEWVVMKNHPLEGAKLTAPLAGWLGPWAKTIAEHHEKYDGSGYPYGLAGEEISLGGRIVAVADCYDTMTAVRSYKRAMSPEAARTELAACAGTHFDPRVVRAFLDVSIGRLRPVAGPLSWLGSLPFVSSVPRLGEVASALGRVGAATAVVGGAVTVGTLASTSHSDRPAPRSAGCCADRHRTPAVERGHLKRPQRKRHQDRNGHRDDVGCKHATHRRTAGHGDRQSGIVDGVDSRRTEGRLWFRWFWLQWHRERWLGGSGSGSDPTTVPGTPPAAPSAPTGVNAVAGNGQVTVSWSAPSNGGSPITSYTVTPYVGGVAQAPHTFGATTAGVVSGLTDGTTYTFTVVASNAVGSSHPSGASAAVTPIAPSLTIPTDLQAGRPEQGDQIIVTFSPTPSLSAFCSAWSTDVVSRTRRPQRRGARNPAIVRR